MTDGVESHVDVGDVQRPLARDLFDIRSDHKRDQHPRVLPLGPDDAHRRPRRNLVHASSFVGHCHHVVSWRMPRRSRAVQIQRRPVCRLHSSRAPSHASPCRRLGRPLLPLRYFWGWVRMRSRYPDLVQQPAEACVAHAVLKRRHPPRPLRNVARRCSLTRSTRSSRAMPRECAHRDDKPSASPPSPPPTY